ncbi:MAG: ABC transporter ATP-binding protein [Clostridia bacterium]|nr:ABC transporter ATP-binding protein [Clostridia bacterium]
MSNNTRELPSRNSGAVLRGQKLKLDKGTFQKLVKRVIGPHKFAWLIVLILIIVSSVCDVQSSLFIGRVIDEKIVPVIDQYARDEIDNPQEDKMYTSYEGIIDGEVDVSEEDMNKLDKSLWDYIKEIGVIFIIAIVSAYLYNRIMIYISQGVQREIRDEMFAKMQTLPVKYFDTNSHGDIMSRYTNDIETLNQLISQSIPSFISTFVTIVAVFISMLMINVGLTIFSVVLILVTMFSTKKVASLASKYSIKQQNDLGKINGFVEEMIHGQKVIKVFNHEENAINDFEGLNDELYDSSVKANTFANILMPIMGKMSKLQYVIIAIVGGAIAINTRVLSLGNLVAFLQLADRLGMPINQVTQQFASVVTALAGAKRIFDLIDEEPEEDDGKVILVNLDENHAETTKLTKDWAWKVPLSMIKNDDKYIELRENYKDVNDEYIYLPVKGHIELVDVTFGYEPNKVVLNDITLYAKPGQKIAFVGATGAGKTTITNLINRFYDIQEGFIKYDGLDIMDIKKEALRKSLGMVLQETNLYTGTIMENIRYGRSDATDEEVIAAAKLANAHGFIKRLPKGYDTMLTENGAELSQGQRQLISIARAAIADPPVMVLDEATSSIDTRTEKIVQDGMDKLMEGRTVFVIAHRLSTVRNAKAIMVLDHGEIIERGEHDFLISQKGTYYKLYTGAFELE